MGQQIPFMLLIRSHVIVDEETDFDNTAITLLERSNLGWVLKLEIFDNDIAQTTVMQVSQAGRPARLVITRSPLHARPYVARHL